MCLALMLEDTSEHTEQCSFDDNDDISLRSRPEMLVITNTSLTDIANLSCLIKL